ncbi:hypothetical protein QVD99_005582 [Batrachochytrium dendrobatidis]|nr:hypothetical protein O5D80_002303 [Batrachochytrium dendrobatidis]KAK5668573.1 hypothetical protein QVD99_005582 [Batrachochytrium dendrobatidis]
MTGETERTICIRCSRVVYAMESAVAEGKTFHRTCFKCTACKKTLAINNYVSYKGSFYCSNHIPRDTSIADTHKTLDIETRPFSEKFEAGNNSYTSPITVTKEERSGNITKAFAKIKKSISRTLYQSDSQDVAGCSGDQLPTDCDDHGSTPILMDKSAVVLTPLSTFVDESISPEELANRVLHAGKPDMLKFKQDSNRVPNQSSDGFISSLESKSNSGTDNNLSEKSTTTMTPIKPSCDIGMVKSRSRPAMSKSTSQNRLSAIFKSKKSIGPSPETVSDKDITDLDYNKSTAVTQDYPSSNLEPNFAQSNISNTELEGSVLTRKRASTLGSISRLFNGFQSHPDVKPATTDVKSHDTPELKIQTNPDSVRQPSNTPISHALGNHSIPPASAELRENHLGNFRWGSRSTMLPWKVSDTLVAFETKAKEASDRDNMRRGPRSPIAYSPSDLNCSRGRNFAAGTHALHSEQLGINNLVTSPLLDNSYNGFTKSIQNAIGISLDDTAAAPKKGLNHEVESSETTRKLADLQFKIKSSARELLHYYEKLQNTPIENRKVIISTFSTHFKTSRESLRELIELTNSVVTVVDLRRNGIELLKFEKEWTSESTFGSSKGLDEFRHLLSNINTNVEFVMRRYPQNEKKLMVKPTTGFREEGTYDDSIKQEEKSPIFKNLYQDYILEHVADAQYYRRYFMNKNHITYVGILEKLGSVIISLRKEDYVEKPAQLGDSKDQITEGSYRAILRIKDQPEKRELIQLAQIKKPLLGKVSTRSVLQLLHKDINPTKLKTVEDKAIEKKILSLDELRYCSRYKFGVLLVKPGQKTDNEFLQNVEGSKGYNKFLDIMGDRVELKGYKGYAGGLDVSNDRTGLYSIGTTWRSFEIMFHVATLLPFVPDDDQQIERKRHIGNDIINIMYLEDDAQFDPRAIRSQFTHIFVVIKQEKNLPALNKSSDLENNDTGYRVSITSNADVLRFGPSLPEPSVFVDMNEMREFLFCKLINGENSAYKAPKFAKPHQRTYRTLFDDIIEEFYGSVSRRSSRNGSFAGPSHEKFKSKDHDSGSSAACGSPSTLASYTNHGISQAGTHIGKLLRHTSANNLRIQTPHLSASTNDVTIKGAINSSNDANSSTSNIKMQAEKCVVLASPDSNQLAVTNQSPSSPMQNSNTVGSSSAHNEIDFPDFESSIGAASKLIITLDSQNEFEQQQSKACLFKTDTLWQSDNTGPDATATTLALHDDALSQAVYGSSGYHTSEEHLSFNNNPAIPTNGATAMES